MVSVFQHFSPNMKCEKQKVESGGAVSFSQASLFAEERVVLVDQVDNVCFFEHKIATPFSPL